MTVKVGAEQEEAGATTSSTESPPESRSPGPMKNTAVSAKAFNPADPGPPPWPNELEPQASMSTIITLGLLTEEEINDPSIYRKNGPSYYILRSGGGITKVKTAAELAISGNTSSDFNTEYFIESIEWDSTIVATTATGNTNANIINFTVTEPYSMGMFVETIRATAIEAGYDSHIEAPLLLIIEFIGWDENSTLQNPSYSKRMIPIKITDIQFEVTASGSAYTVEAIPYNEQALGNGVQSIQVDTTIRGRNVAEMLQSGLDSLASTLNTRELTKEETEQKLYGDQFIFVFPTENAEFPAPSGSSVSDDSATVIEGPPSGVQDTQVLYKSVQGSDAEIQNQSEWEERVNAQLGKVKGRSQLGEAIRGFAEQEENINDIGKTKIIEDWLESGQHPFGNEGLSYDEEKEVYIRNGAELTLSDDVRIFKFKKGTKIQDIIEEVIMASSYAKEFTKQLKDPPSDGMVTWFKIETQTYLLRNNAALKKIGRYPKIFVYRIVPYKAHTNIFKAPTSAAQGVEEIKAQAAKQYQYIYTGKNIDILDFEINYDLTYNTPTLADKGQSQDRNKAQDGVAHQPPSDAAAANEGPDGTNAEGVVPVEDKASLDTYKDGGSVNDSPEVAVAKQWNEILTKSDVNLVNIEITIMGDPYYIVESGTGNYVAKNSSYQNINADGQMNHQNGEVYINLIFRTPIDYNTESGVMIFPEDATEIIKGFSGIFRVNQVKNMIERNTFKQTLSLQRMLGQEDRPVASLFKTADASTSILKDLSGSPFDPSPPYVNPEAVEQAAGALAGNFISQVLAAGESQIREAFGEITDALAATATQIQDQIQNLVNDALASIPGLPPGFSLDIDPEFVTPELLDDIISGNISAEQLTARILEQQGQGLLQNATDAINSNLDFNANDPFDNLNFGD